MNQTSYDKDTDDFGEIAETPAPFWKRPLIAGFSLPWLVGAAVMLVLAFWFLFLRPQPGSLPSEQAFSEVETTFQEAAPANDASPPVRAPATVASPVSGMDTLAADLKTELDKRDQTLNASLEMLRTSITRLGETIKKDETYLQQLRQQIDTLQGQVASLSKTPAASAGQTVKKKASPVAGMKVMSMESGMAWIRWQGSTWAVREGDTLGKVTVRRIDPATRTVITSGGTLR